MDSPNIPDTTNDREVGGAKENTNRNIPNYKPAILKLYSIAILFLCVCSLFAITEYARRTLPAITGYRDAQRKKQHDTSTSILPRQQSHQVFQRSNDTSLLNTNVTSVATANSTVTRALNATQSTRTGTLTIATAGAFSAKYQVLHLDPDKYANPEGIRTHISVGTAWTFGPNMVYTVVPPGVDVSDRCVARAPMYVLTDDPTACEYIVKFFDTSDPDWGWAGTYVDIHCADDTISRLLDAAEEAFRNNEPPPCAREELRLGTTFRYAKSVVQTAELPGSTTTAAQVVPGPDGRPTTLTRVSVLPGSKVTYTLGPVPTNAATQTSVPADIITTMTDAAGRATRTATIGQRTLEKGVVLVSITVPLKDAAGSVTGYLTTQVPHRTGIRTLTDQNGVPTATTTELVPEPYLPTTPPRPVIPIATPVAERIVFTGLTRANYFVSSLPILLAMLLAIPIQILDSHIKALSPFHALATRRGGASAADSLCMSPGGAPNLLVSVRLLFAFRESLPFLSDLLLLCSGLLVSLSGEAVTIALYGDCGDFDSRGCGMAQAIHAGAVIAAEVMLGIMGVVIVIMAALLWRWRSGVAANPWSIAALSSLLPRTGETRWMFQEAVLPLRLQGYLSNRNRKRLRESFGERAFGLRHYNVTGCGGATREEYGIVVVVADASGTPVTKACSPAKGHGIPGRPVPSWLEANKGEVRELAAFLHQVPLRNIVERVGQMAFLALLCVLTIIIIYYETTTGDTPFERFMAGQTFGVRFIFTGIGVIIELGWKHIFSQFTVRDPYRRLLKKPQPPNILLVTRDMTPFTAIYGAVRRLDLYGTAVSLSTALSIPMPLLLSNIPFRLTLTWTTHQVCAWSSVAILLVMITTGLVSLFIRNPDMPLDPTSIASCLYYVCDSEMLEGNGLEGLMTEKEMSRVLTAGSAAKARYRFGKVVGVSGTTRVGVDYAARTVPA